MSLTFAEVAPTRGSKGRRDKSFLLMVRGEGRFIYLDIVGGYLLHKSHPHYISHSISRRSKRNQTLSIYTRFNNWVVVLGPSGAHSGEKGRCFPI